jgi:ABC-type branched-subunit amino acid transport system substrate-binding protein
MRSYWLGRVSVVLALVAAVGCTKKKRRSFEEYAEADKGDKKTEAGENGVRADGLVIGTTGSFVGPLAALPEEGYRGAMAEFLDVNAQGGVHGRKIELIARDDSYDGPKAAENMKLLITQDKVFCVFGGNGTEVLGKSTPVLLEHKATGVFGFSTHNGADVTRTPPGFDVWYNVTASFRQEAEAIVETLVTAGFKKLGIFFQDDGFGKNALAGVRTALEQRALKLVSEQSHVRGMKFDGSAKEQVEAMRKAGVEAIVSFTTYQAAAALVRDARDAGYEVPIANSSVANDTFLRLIAAHEKKVREKEPQKAYMDRPLLNVHLVPNWEDESIPIVAEFRRLMDMRNPQVPNDVRDPNYRTLPYQTISLQGFLNAKVFVEALRRTGPNLTRAAFRATLEKMRDYDPGLGGTTVTFSTTRHQGIDKLFLVGVQDGRWISLADPTGYLHGHAAKTAPPQASGAPMAQQKPAPKKP